jgi:hypothetical protein
MEELKKAVEEEHAGAMNAVVGGFHFFASEQRF